MTEKVEPGFCDSREIVNLVAEATSPSNDGWTRKGAIDRLVTIRDFISGVLRKENNDSG